MPICGPPGARGAVKKTINPPATAAPPAMNATVETFDQVVAPCRSGCALSNCCWFLHGVPVVSPGQAVTEVDEPGLH